MRTSILLALPTVLVLATGCNRAQLQVDGDRAYLTGTLGNRSLDLLTEMVEEHPEVELLVFTQVPGSKNDEANMATGRLIREAGLNTHLEDGGMIASGGVDLFCAGVTRTMGQDVEVGVHSWREWPSNKEATDFPDDDPAHDAQLDYFGEMLGDGGADFYFFTIHSAPGGEIHWMSADEIDEYGLISAN